MSSELNIVTGALGYTGKYIARELIKQGKEVLTLTGHSERPNPFGSKVAVAPFNFDKPDLLIKCMQGAATLFNTYWVRFAYGQITYDKAVANSIVLIKAAEAAGIRKIIHISITNASENSTLPYFKGKGLLEKAIIKSKLSYAIIRPTVIFGYEDILINNIAWLLRKYPVFVVPGSGEYKLQPIFVEDLAKLAVKAVDDRRMQLLMLLVRRYFRLMIMISDVNRNIFIAVYAQIYAMPVIPISAIIYRLTNPDVLSNEYVIISYILMSLIFTLGYFFESKNNQYVQE